MQSEDKNIPSKVSDIKKFEWIHVVFLISGFAALVYQVAWQRTLFSIFGINIESVTIIVTVFMLGLGIGSLIGGQISKNSNFSLLVPFGIIELTIGIFGVFSLDIFSFIGTVTLGFSAFSTALTIFALLLIPTLLMGSTLPLLVTYYVNLYGNVGRSVGILYFVNTLGAAFASVIAVLLLLPNFGLQKSVFIAAFLNLAVGLLVIGSVIMRREQR